MAKKTEKETLPQTIPWEMLTTELGPGQVFPLAGGRAVKLRLHTQRTVMGLKLNIYVFTAKFWPK